MSRAPLEAVLPKANSECASSNASAAKFSAPARRGQFCLAVARIDLTPRTHALSVENRFRALDRDVDGGAHTPQPPLRVVWGACSGEPREKCFDPPSRELSRQRPSSAAGPKRP
jgi:hypothetical protein